MGRHSGTQGAVGAGRALPEVSSFVRLGRRSGREGESTWGVARGLRMSEVGLLSAGLRYEKASHTQQDGGSEVALAWACGGTFWGF